MLNCSSTEFTESTEGRIIVSVSSAFSVLKFLLIAIRSIRGIRTEIYFQLVPPLPFHELRVALGAVTLREVYAILLFSGCSHMCASVRPCLNDVHHSTSALRIAADIERVITHQYPPHRINAYVEIHFCHFTFAGSPTSANGVHSVGRAEASMRFHVAGRHL